MKALAARFVPAADEVHGLQVGKGPEGDLFRKIAEQGHYAGRTRPSSTRQGIYAAAPSGRLLASINSNRPDQMADMLRKALAVWETLPKEERLLPGEVPASPPDRWRWESKYPTDGLVLKVTSRDVGREGARGDDWPARAWNRDFAWFKRGEARSLLPVEIAAGAEHEVPAALVRRIARLHLVDDVRGQTQPYEDAQVTSASLRAEVVKVEEGNATLRFEGASATHQEGRWPIGGQKEGPPEPQVRGFEGTWLGRATYDLKAERFTSFEMVVVGLRTGATRYNARDDDLGPAPMGYVFALAGDAPSEHVPPAAVWGYGW